MLPVDSAGKKVLERFMRKSCKRKVFSCKRKELRIEKLIMKKAIDFMSNGRVMITQSLLD